MSNEKMLNRIYGNIDKLIDHYADLPETEEADKRFWEYARENIFQDNRDVKERELESVLYDVILMKSRDLNMGLIMPLS